MASAIEWVVRMASTLNSPHLELLARFDRMEIGAEAVFLQLVLDEAQGQPGAVDRNLDLLQQIRHAADMVLMAVVMTIPTILAEFSTR